MRRVVMVVGVCLAAFVSVPDALAQKPAKCVNPSLSVVVHDITGGLESDRLGEYRDGWDGVYAKMNHCAGTDDIVLGLDVLQRQMGVSLSNLPHVASRVDVTGVGSVDVGCDTKSATIWFGDPDGGFVRFNSPAAETVQVCRISPPDGPPVWTVQPTTSSATAARFKFDRGKYRYWRNESVPFAITITQITQ